MANIDEFSKTLIEAPLPRREFLKKGALAGLGVTTLYMTPKITTVLSKPAYASLTGVCVPMYSLKYLGTTKTIAPFDYNGTAAEFYNYNGDARNTPGEVEHANSANTPYNFFSPFWTSAIADPLGIEEIQMNGNPVNNVMMFFLLRDKNGKVGLYTVIDSPTDGSGGSGVIRYSNLPASADWVVKDDPTAGKHTKSGSTAHLNAAWGANETDGGVISHLNGCEFNICVDFPTSATASTLPGLNYVCFATPGTDGKTRLHEIGKNKFNICATD